MRARQGPSLWVDVGTLLGWRGQPAGIPRTLAQLVRAWQADPDVPLRLCRFDPTFGIYTPVAPDALAPCPGAPVRPRRGLVLRHWLESGALRLPAEHRDLAWHLAQLARHLGRLGRDLVHGTVARVRRNLRRCQRAPAPASFAPDDVLLLAGTGVEEFAALATQQQVKALGTRIVHLIYDITPLRCPHLCAPALTRRFAAWLPGALAVADLLLTISEHARRDLNVEATERGLTLPPVETVRLGDEPGTGPEARPAGLPEGPFALYVSTISVHKNQGLLVNVWRRLIEKHNQVPALVLVGGPGWRGEEIARDLQADVRLARRVVWLHGVDDAGLRWLYRHCLFTLFPSHYEGWGLPVAEALVHGKPCIASNASSLPEVGGTLVDYHDPLDGAGCLTLVEQALFAPGWLAARSDRIQRSYRPMPWSEAARRLFAAVAARTALVARPAA